MSNKDQKNTAENSEAENNSQQENNKLASCPDPITGAIKVEGERPCKTDKDKTDRA